MVAHYLMSFLKDEELFLQHVAKVLAEDGMFSCNRYDVSSLHMYWKQAFEQMGLETGFITEIVEEKQKKQDAFVAMLGKYFSKVEAVKLANNMRYDKADELFEQLCEYYAGSKKYLLDKESRIKAYLEKLITEQGEVILTSESQFWHCYK